MMTAGQASYLAFVFFIGYLCPELKYRTCEILGKSSPAEIALLF
jgi:hypothetical protein